ncbi:hypothetical protein BTVI_65328 [Pitangus sulphuratus]|nr:hypothetical protein BTVI_65328 [Pitangus sulphuratus]
MQEGLGFVQRNRYPGKQSSEVSQETSGFWLDLEGHSQLSLAGTSLLHTTHTTEVGDWARNGSPVWTQPSCCSSSPLSTLLGILSIPGILDTLGILGILDILDTLHILDILDTLGMLDTLSPGICLQKLTFWEILKPRAFLGHLL